MKKKLLLGTTALIAAGVVSGGVAQAAEEPITAGVGGYFRSAMGLISQDDNDGEFAEGAQSFTLGNDIEIVVSGKTTLDNGITAGFNANIEGNGGGTAANGSAALDERFVFFRGGFGQLRIGQIESARQSMTVFAPSGNYNFGVNSPFFIFANPGNAAGFFNVRTYDDGLGNEDNIKLVYYSPTFNGFRLGASYSPEDGNNGQYGGNAGDAASGFQNNASVSAEFHKTFGSVSLGLMLGWEGYVVEQCGATAAVQTCDNNVDSTQIGGSVGFGEWSIGGGWLETEQTTFNANGSSRDREDFDLGVAWWHGPFGVGLQYGQAELDIAADNTTDELKIYELNATYVLGPGIDVGAAIAKGEYDDATAGGLDNDYTEFKMSAALNF
ncbi:MAG: porin [Rhodospirillaceae bacterium]|nr:porin [Rhodospirillaceae bacterium]